jgi:hypothetical protein
MAAPGEALTISQQSERSGDVQNHGLEVKRKEKPHHMYDKQFETDRTQNTKRRKQRE